MLKAGSDHEVIIERVRVWTENQQEAGKRQEVSSHISEGKSTGLGSQPDEARAVRRQGVTGILHPAAWTEA